jgi:hypothetical protein
VRGVWVSENLQKLIGVVVMAVLVVVGVVVSSGDDTDFSRNVSFRATPSTFAGADRVKEADCCDKTLVELKQIQDQLFENNSRLIKIASQLETLLGTEPEASRGRESSDVQQLAAQLTETCPEADPMTWASQVEVAITSMCVRSYLTDLPLELARQVVLAHGKFGFFHRWNFDSAGTWSQDPNKLKNATTEEACEPIFYGNNPPPRLAIAVDTRDGVVLTNWSDFHFAKWTSYMQEIEHWDLIPGDNLSADNKEEMHWPTEIETHGYC